MNQDSWLTGLSEERCDGDLGQRAPTCPDLQVGPQGRPGSWLLAASLPVCPSRCQAWQISAILLPSAFLSLAWTLGLLGSDHRVQPVSPGSDLKAGDIFCLLPMIPI